MQGAQNPARHVVELSKHQPLLSPRAHSKSPTSTVEIRAQITDTDMFSVQGEGKEG